MDPENRPAWLRGPQRNARRTVVVAIALAMAGSACGGEDGGDAAVGGDSTPTVLATTSIWADVVGNLACEDAVEVATIVPPGGDPHGFEASLADRERMDGAALVVANGLLLEEGLQSTLDEVADDGTPVFWVGDHVDTIPYDVSADHAEDDEHADEGDEHAHDGDDPHIWFDPVRVSAMLPALADQLVTHAGLSSETVEACMSAYRAELAVLDEEIRDMVASVPETRRKLVTNHDSLGYLADRYGFEVVGTVIAVPSGLAETNPAQLEELAEAIERTGVTTIFADTQHSDDDAEALADRVGDVEVVTLLTGTLGEPGSEDDTYIGLVRTNATQITGALG